MHIVVLESEPSTKRGGQELSLFDVCRGLSQRGHKVSLIYATDGNLLKQYREFCTCVLQVKGYSISRDKPLTSTFDLLTDSWQAWRKLPKVANTIIYINQYQDSLFGSVLALVRKVPLVCHLRQPRPPVIGWQRSITMKNIQQFIAVSNQTKLDWLKSGVQKNAIDVVYNGIDLETFKPTENLANLRQAWNIASDSRVISYIGRLDKVKGLETLIKAFELLSNSNPSLKLLLAGKPVCHTSPEAGQKYEVSLKQLVMDLNLQKYVHFLGHVAEPVPLYQLSDVTVLPSLNPEPFGRTIIESMACGTPVVASRIGGMPEILTGEFKDGLSQPGDTSNLAATLQGKLNWRRQDPSLSQRCREHIYHTFSLNKMVTGVEQSLLKVI